jgi:hypothetical protein
MADLLWRNQTTGENIIYLMNGATIRRTTVDKMSSAWTVAEVGDFNGDGMADILWRNQTTGENFIWSMNADTVRSTPGRKLGWWVLSNNAHPPGTGCKDGSPLAGCLR